MEPIDTTASWQGRPWKACRFAGPGPHVRSRNTCAWTKPTTVTRDLVIEFGYTAHVSARGEQAQAIKRQTRCKVRHWVVERTHSWMNRFRRILIRWEKKPQNYLALLHLVCALITHRAIGLPG